MNGLWWASAPYGRRAARSSAILRPSQVSLSQVVPCLQSIAGRDFTWTDRSLTARTWSWSKSICAQNAPSWNDILAFQTQKYSALHKSLAALTCIRRAQNSPGPAHAHHWLVFSCQLMSLLSKPAACCRSMLACCHNSCVGTCRSATQTVCCLPNCAW